MGLLEDDPHGSNLSHLLQMLARFMLEKITTDYGNISTPNVMVPVRLSIIKCHGKRANTPQKIFNTEASSLIRCSQCKTEYPRPGQTMVTDLLYPDMVSQLRVMLGVLGTHTVYRLCAAPRHRESHFHICSNLVSSAKRSRKGGAVSASATSPSQPRKQLYLSPRS